MHFIQDVAVAKIK